MKKIIDYIREYFKQEIKWGYFLLVLGFAAVAVALQYEYKFANVYVEHHKKEWSYFLRAFVLYAIPFAGTFLLYSVCYKRWEFWRNGRFVGLVVFVLSVYALRCGVQVQTDIVNAIATSEHKRYWLKVANQLAYGIVLFVFPVLWWWWKDRKSEKLYGFNYKGISLKPYFMVLLLLVPLVVYASTQSDFLKAYPRYANSLKGDTGGHLFYYGLFELSYAWDFVMNEFFFRGFIVLAFAKLVGRAVILPMVVFYVFIHFGKPLGETISSFFGGLALGVIAYETRSVYGGIILHVGIAWLMEIGATVGRLLLDNAVQ